MGLTRTTSGAGLPAGVPFSLAVTANDTCFISGMPALGDDGKYRPGTFDDEVTRAWDNIMRIATAAGFVQEEIVFVQSVLADIEDYAALNDWWRRQFPDITTAPARFTFQAGALPFGCKIEVQAVAARGHRAVGGQQ